MKTEVTITVKNKILSKLPKYIAEALQIWAALVEEMGIEEVRKISGYHDEPLSGDREGQRSIRLNKAYRAFYTIEENGEVKLIDVFEVNKHKY